MIVLLPKQMLLAALLKFIQMAQHSQPCCRQLRQLVACSQQRIGATADVLLPLLPAGVIYPAAAQRSYLCQYATLDQKTAFAEPDNDNSLTAVQATNACPACKLILVNKNSACPAKCTNTWTPLKAAIRLLC